MSSWTANVLSALIISIVLTGILIPQILLIAFRKQLFDVPDERKIHKGVVPRLGGIAFMPAIFLSIACITGVNYALFNGEVFLSLAHSVLPVSFGMCAVMMMYLVGMADDLIGVRYSAKFVVQIIAGVFIAASGLLIDNLHGFIGIHTLYTPVAWMLTILVVVFIVNAVNLIDGIDGLCSGLCGIALLFYGLVYLTSGDYTYSLIAFAGLGTLVPFFYYNVFGDARVGTKIFMGDTGALTTGISLCILSLRMCTLEQVGEISVNPIVLAFAPLIIPCFDVFRVYLHRLKRHANPFLPDKSHIHHKLLALGMKQRYAMITILLVSAVFIVSNALLSPYINVTWLVIIDIVVWVVVNMIITRAIRKREKRLNLDKPLYE